MNYFVKRLKEMSTWRGLILFGGAIFGVVFQPEELDKVLAAAVTIAGFVGAFFPDRFGTGSGK